MPEVLPGLTLLSLLALCLLLILLLVGLAEDPQAVQLVVHQVDRQELWLPDPCQVLLVLPWVDPLADGLQGQVAALQMGVPLAASLLVRAASQEARSLSLDLVFRLRRQASFADLFRCAGSHQYLVEWHPGWH